MTGGIVASISHKGPITVALANENRRGVGIDVECIGEADSRLARRVLTPEELGTLGTIEDDFQATLFTMVHFSVKEAIYKCVGPDAQSLLDFNGIQLRVDPKALLAEGEWLTLPVCVDELEYRIAASIRIDGRWLMAASMLG